METLIDVVAGRLRACWHASIASQGGLGKRKSVARQIAGQCLRAATVLSILAVTACGGGGGGDGRGDPPRDQSNISGTGWLDIYDPTSESSFETYNPTISLSGSSFEPPAARGPGPRSPFVYFVSWENTATSETGLASVCVNCLFSLTYWDIHDINLAMGANPITVTAEDDAGNVGRETITVNRVLDTTAPVISSVSPLAGATGVDPAAILFVYFSEPMAPETINDATVLLTTLAGTPVPVTVSASETYARQGYAYLQAVNPLAGGTTYRISVTTGVGDARGNFLAAPFSSTFTTR